MRHRLLWFTRMRTWIGLSKAPCDDWVHLIRSAPSRLGNFILVLQWLMAWASCMATFIHWTAKVIHAKAIELVWQKQELLVVCVSYLHANETLRILWRLRINSDHHVSPVTCIVIMSLTIATQHNCSLFISDHVIDLDWFLARLFGLNTASHLTRYGW